MATITLTANTNLSALSIVDGDSIALAGFQLTLDIQPTVTSIDVRTVGTGGTVVFSSGWVIPTWDFFAGTTAMIVTLPADAEIGSITGGTVANAVGCATNNGIIGTVTGGTFSTARGVNANNGHITTANGSGISSGVNTNNGTVTTANGGTGVGIHGINNNSGTVTTANGGTAVNANGVNNNSGTVTTANGGVSNACNGVNINNSVVITANGGGVASAFGVATNNAYVLRLTDDISRGVQTFALSLAFVEGPFIDGEIVSSRLETIFTLGAMHVNAITPVGVDIIVMSEGGGGGAAFQLVGGGGLVY